MTKPNPSGKSIVTRRNAGTKLVLALLLFFMAVLVVTWKGGKIPTDRRRGDVPTDQIEDIAWRWQGSPENAQLVIPTEQPIDCRAFSEGVMWYSTEYETLRLCQHTESGYEYLELVGGGAREFETE